MPALWPIPALPLAGFVLLTFFGSRLGRRAVNVVGVGSVALSAVMAIRAALPIISSPNSGGIREQLWTWVHAGGLDVGLTFYIDPLAIVFVVVVTVVSFLIHLYSVEYMRGDDAYPRFFAYLNLFVASMLTLVMADNLLLLYLGWEGVGLCSYLLIGFWYRDPSNGLAARKAFVVTRVGDVALAIALFIIFRETGSLDFRSVSQQAGATWASGSALATAVALLLLGGAVGKSAQLPLQTWLPDAMAGPTPVSALIHAATMVTAGVYLLARTHVLLALSPVAMTIIGVVGALTLLLGATSALTQTDIKRVLAYSTISQIGYMFLALGVGAWSAAVFHFMTHAFFKALLFLGAGIVILALHHEQDLSHMGGLRRALPATFICFLIGAASLSALPLVTAGFYSKDLILADAWMAGGAGRWLYAAGLVGALLTAIYSFRLVFVVFYGQPRIEVLRRPGAAALIPVVSLAVLAIIGGFVETPAALGGISWLSGFLSGTFGAGAHGALHGAAHGAANVTAQGAAHVAPHVATHQGGAAVAQILGALVPLLGVLCAYTLYYRRSDVAIRWAQGHAANDIGKLLFSGWGFDRLYGLLFVKPYNWLARVLSGDPIDLIYRAIAAAFSALHSIFAQTQTGRVRLYALGIAAGAIIGIGLMLLR